MQQMEIESFNRKYHGLLDRTFKCSYRVYLVDKGYQKGHIRAQAIQLNNKIARAVADIVCHALELTRKITSVNSGCTKMVDKVS